MSEAEIETARLLARFKLQVRRCLHMPVDLALLTDDAEYADGLFREVEERAEDEDLLTLLVRLRSRLHQPEEVEEVVAAVPEVEVEVEPAVAAAPERKLMRDYRFGARG